MQESYTYEGHTYQTAGGSQTNYSVDHDTVYTNSDGTGVETTSYAYTWYPNSPQEETVVTTLPVVSADDNGSGVAAQTVDFYDAEGNLVWSEDARGFLTENLYDPTTGLVTETIQDANTALVDPAQLPTDPTTGQPLATPVGGGQNLVTDYSYDAEGRLAQTLGPEHSAMVGGVATNVRTASWTVYDDADHATTSAEGYQTVSTGYFTLVNPVSLTITNPDGQVTSQINATVGPVGSQVGWASSTTAEVSLGSLSPLVLLSATATGGIGLPPQSAYTAWTTGEYSHKQLVSTRVYYVIPANGIGDAATSYDETDYGYNAVGTEEWTKTPAGTITWNVLNAQGQTMSTWAGTNDTDATATDPTGGAAGQSAGNNMVEVSSNLFDPDGDVTSTTEYPDSNPADNRTTAYGYDWQDRLVSTMTFDGVYYTYTYKTYDNLGEVLQTQDFQAASPWTVNPSGDLLLSQSTTSYDSLGEVYQSTDFLVISGVAGTAQATGYWYDPDGNQVKLTDPDGNATTWQLDGLDQATSQTNQLGASDVYTFDGAGELTQEVDRDGRTTSYIYDGIGRETGESWYDASANLTETITEAYNAAGLLTSASDDNLVNSTVATDSYLYDAAGRVTSETQQIPGLDPVVTLNEQYTAGNRTQLAATIGDDDRFRQQLPVQGLLGQMSQVTQTGASGGDAVAAKTATFHYDNLGEFSTISRYQNADATAEPGRPVAYGYDADGQLTVARLLQRRQHAAQLLLDLRPAGQHGQFDRNARQHRRFAELHQRLDRATADRHGHQRAAERILFLRLQRQPPDGHQQRLPGDLHHRAEQRAFL